MNNGNKNIGNSELIALANRRREQMKQAEAQKPQPAPAPQTQPTPKPQPAPQTQPDRSREREIEKRRAAAQKQKAEAILREVKANPDDFEKIAREKSEDKVSGERGGELGFFTKHDMVPEFSNAAFAMKPNTISDSLVKSGYGYHIIKVTDRIEAGQAPFVKVKDEIKFYLETQEQLKVLKNLTDGLVKNAKIEYIDESYNPDKIAKKAAKEEGNDK